MVRCDCSYNLSDAQREPVGRESVVPATDYLGWALWGFDKITRRDLENSPKSSIRHPHRGVPAKTASPSGLVPLDNEVMDLAGDELRPVAVVGAVG